MLRACCILFSAPKKTADDTKSVALITLEAPATIKSDQTATVKIKHAFPVELGEKAIQVTLKGADNEHLVRKEVKASGTGEIEVTFDIPAGIPGGKVSFAGLAGISIKDALQHLQTKPVPVK